MNPPLFQNFVNEVHESTQSSEMDPIEASLFNCDVHGDLEDSADIDADDDGLPEDAEQDRLNDEVYCRIMGQVDDVSKRVKESTAADYER